jgi:dTDP-4-amino-4,6-dideoxygalactose transaminase
MSNIMAAIGVEQLRRFPEMAASRQRLAQCYDGLLKDNPGVRLLPHDYRQVVPHIYVALIQGVTDREAIRGRLAAQGIQTGIHYQPNHELSLYRRMEVRLRLSQVDALFPRLLSLPLHVDMDEDQVTHVCNALTKAL